MAEKKADAPKFVTVKGKQYEAIDITYRGTLYTIRELSVKESRDINKAATGEDGVLNGESNLIMSLVAAIVAPENTTEDDIDDWGGKQYLTLSRAFNKVNSLVENPSGEG